MTEEQKTAAASLKFRQACLDAYREGLRPSDLVRILDDAAWGLVDEDHQQFCRNAWDVDDVRGVFDVAIGEAVEFLRTIESQLNDRMTERGWEVIETLGDERKFKRYEAEDFEL